MIQWTDEQRAQVWDMYVREQLTFTQIAERFGHLGATKNAIAGLINRIHKARGEEVEHDITRAKLFGEHRARRSGTYGGYGRKRKLKPMTAQEIKDIKDAQKK